MNKLTPFSSLDHLIGHTPLLRLQCKVDKRTIQVFAKLETLNLTGSIKDRMALQILRQGRFSGQLKPGAPIFEASSGNTGISLAAIGRAMGHPVRIYMPDWLSRERVMLIEGFGAEVIPISRVEGGFLGAIEKAEQDMAANQGFLPRQFDNADNVDAHFQTTGPELLSQLATIDLQPSHFVAGVGTGGTVMGVGKFLQQELANVSIHPMEPANSPTMRTGERQGNHRIQGISDEFIPSIVDLSTLDSIVDVWDGDAIIMAQRLAKELGIGVGISSGANLLAALLLALEAPEQAVVATVFADSNKKYLSTDLWHQEAVLDTYLSPRVELLGFDTIPCAPARS